MPVDDDATIRSILESSRTIAVVGASDNPWRDSHDIMRYLLEHGYRVFPVNPRYQTVMEHRCYPTLGDVPEPVDLVDVFRRSEAVPGIVEQTLAIKARVLWLQLGVVHEEAVRHAEEGGVQVVMDRCIAVDHRRLVRSR